eukprot:TRINITY_DN30113_c0_g1_i1.p1 TRINITY_DN30113_c0_g1~~TRINITY_DN30113_c0_g1_i1.p1  ORF type:complete len:1331 (-),score=244.65 TRINITY_DN30113_c0_g1_i1:239-4093(-)
MFDYRRVMSLRADECCRLVVALCQALVRSQGVDGGEETQQLGGLEHPLLLAAEAWIEAYTPPPLDKSHMIYPGEVMVNVAVLEPWLEPVLALDAARRERIAAAVETGRVLRSALSIFRTLDSRNGGSLAWAGGAGAGGEVHRFVTAALRHLGLEPPTEDHLYPLSKSFGAGGASAALEATKCICLVDAVCRAACLLRSGAGGTRSASGANGSTAAAATQDAPPTGDNVGTSCTNGGAVAESKAVPIGSDGGSDSELVPPRAAKGGDLGQSRDESTATSSPPRPRVNVYAQSSHGCADSGEGGSEADSAQSNAAAARIAALAEAEAASQQRRLMSARNHPTALAESWVSVYQALPMSATVSITYSSGVVIDFVESTPLLRPLALENAAHRVQMIEHIERGGLLRLALQVFKDVNTTGYLAWHDGWLLYFVTALFAELELTPPSAAQVHWIYDKFDEGRNAHLNTSECLCLIDALFRAVFFIEDTTAVDEAPLPSSSLVVDGSPVAAVTEQQLESPTFPESPPTPPPRGVTDRSDAVGCSEEKHMKSVQDQSRLLSPSARVGQSPTDLRGCDAVCWTDSNKERLAPLTSQSTVEPTGESTGDLRGGLDVGGTADLTLSTPLEFEGECPGIARLEHTAELFRGAQRALDADIAQACAAMRKLLDEFATKAARLRADGRRAADRIEEADALALPTEERLRREEAARAIAAEMGAASEKLRAMCRHFGSAPDAPQASGAVCRSASGGRRTFQNRSCGDQQTSPRCSLSFPQQKSPHLLQRERKAEEGPQVQQQPPRQRQQLPQSRRKTGRQMSWPQHGKRHEGRPSRTLETNCETVNDEDERSQFKHQEFGQQKCIISPASSDEADRGSWRTQRAECERTSSWTRSSSMPSRRASTVKTDSLWRSLDKSSLLCAEPSDEHRSDVNHLQRLLSEDSVATLSCHKEFEAPSGAAQLAPVSFVGDANGSDLAGVDERQLASGVFCAAATPVSSAETLAAAPTSARGNAAEKHRTSNGQAKNVPLRRPTAEMRDGCGSPRVQTLSIHPSVSTISHDQDSEMWNGEECDDLGDCIGRVSALSSEAAQSRIVLRGLPSASYVDLGGLIDDGMRWYLDGRRLSEVSEPSGLVFHDNANGGPVIHRVATDESFSTVNCNEEQHYLHAVSFASASRDVNSTSSSMAVVDCASASPHEALGYIGQNVMSIHGIDRYNDGRLSWLAPCSDTLGNSGSEVGGLQASPHMHSMGSVSSAATMHCNEEASAGAVPPILEQCETNSLASDKSAPPSDVSTVGCG